MGKGLYWKVNKRLDRVVFYKTRATDLRTIRIIVPMSNPYLLKVACRVLNVSYKRVVG